MSDNDSNSNSKDNHNHENGNGDAADEFHDAQEDDLLEDDLADDDDDDDDDWSRQVETDEASLHHTGLLLSTGTPSVNANNPYMEAVAEDIDLPRPAVVPHPPPPVSLKQEAILRERQRRIETERARLKRQFANNHPSTASQASSNAANHNQYHNNNSYNNSNNNNNNQHTSTHAAAGGGFLGESLGGSLAPHQTADSASIAETVESTMVHPDEEHAQNPEMRLGFNMERFLRNSQDFSPEAVLAAQEEHANALQDKEAPPILMERFINQPVVVENATQEETTAAAAAAQRSVSFQPAAAPTATLTPSQQPTSATPATPATSLPSVAYSSFEEDTTTNVSIQVHPDDEDEDAEQKQDDTYLLSGDMDGGGGLTEAYVQAMVATEEASIANAPPSERDELLSEVGELADFGTPSLSLGMRHDFSVGTPTTAVDSVSRADPQSSSVAVSSDRQSETTAELPTTPPLHTNTNTTSERPTTPPTSNQTAAAMAPPPPPLMEPASPQITQHEYTPWSPPGKMHVSPLQPNAARASLTTDALRAGVPALPTAPHEMTPLLDVPPEIITTRQAADESVMVVHHDDHADEDDDVRATSLWNVWRHPNAATTTTTTTTILSTPPYAQKTVLQRTWPERGAWVVVTWILTMPLLVWVSHVWQHGLCHAESTPLARLVLWTAFLPVILAGTRHVNHQSSEATRLALQAGQVRQSSWHTWWPTEGGTAALLGLQGAVVWSVVALIVSSGDGRLAGCVAATQFSASLVAGLVGSGMPHAAAWLWMHWVVHTEDVQLEKMAESVMALGNAVQDLLGAFLWWLVSYLWLFEKAVDVQTSGTTELLDDRLSSFCA